MKKNNLIVSILNMLAVIILFAENYIFKTIIKNLGIMSSSKSISNYAFVNLIINDKTLIFGFFLLLVIAINIVCAVQSRENKKAFFWYVALSAFYVINILLGLLDDIYFFYINDITEYIELGVLYIVPIILAVKNLICIKKNNAKVINVISYIFTIILSVLMIIEIIPEIWPFIIIFMQIIRNRNTDTDEVSTIIQKIMTVIYLMTILVILVLSGIGLVQSKEIHKNMQAETSNFFYDISNFNGLNNEEIYIPVEKDNKYGFINKTGEEKIPCEYDIVSFFNIVEVDNKKYHLALAKNDGKYYILTKSNEKKLIEGKWEEKIKRLEVDSPELSQYKTGIVTNLSEIFRSSLENEYKIVPDVFLPEESDETITLNTNDEGSYIYSNDKFEMTLDEIRNTEDYTTQYELKIIKNNKTTKKRVKIPTFFSWKNEILPLNKKNTIPIETENEKGWIDMESGEILLIAKRYSIQGEIDNKIVVQDTEGFIKIDDFRKESTFYVINKKGKVLMKSNAIQILDDIILYKKENKKIVMVDTDFKEISKEYDKIIVNGDIDIILDLASYYP